MKFGALVGFGLLYSPAGNVAREAEKTAELGLLSEVFKRDPDPPWQGVPFVLRSSSHLTPQNNVYP